MNKIIYNSMISIDWLQVYCHQLNMDWSSIVSRETIYDIRLLPYGSRQFSKIYQVLSRDGRDFATIQTSPCSPIMSPWSAIIKLDNRILYNNDCVNQLMHFMSAYNFQYKNISRIDICHDSNYLAHGLRHSTLINNFLTNKYEKVGQSNYTLQGSDGRTHEYSYIRFGSRSSGCCAYIYDKTKEMREVKNKPYILNAWLRSGINPDIPVWRCEISIKADATTLVNKDTGVLFRLSTDIITQQNRIENLFKAYSDKYLHFVRNKGQKNKKNMQDIELFEWRAMADLKVHRVSIERNSGRMQKIMYNKLEEIASMDNDFSLEAKEAALILKKEYVGLYGMTRIANVIDEHNAIKHRNKP